MRCTLCNGKTADFREYDAKKYLRCENCLSILLSPANYLTAESEKQRYLTHNNDVGDPRYQSFVSPITTHVIKSFPNNCTGLDYGCGTGPVAAVELEKKGYVVNLYDPYFQNHPGNLQQFYNFIICCEVMEHFYNPLKEFTLLSQMLLPGGKLYCKTSLYTETQNFDTWYYKNDPTHVFLYTHTSLEWIRDNLNFSNLEVSPKLIILSKN